MYPTLKKLPWFSLVLLLVTYITVGRLFSVLYDPWFVWLIIVVGIILLAALLASPRAKFRGSSGLLKSETKAFSFVVVGALLSVVILWRLHVFIHTSIAILSAILVKLDAQTARLTNQQTFWIIVVVSLVGLGLGAALHNVIAF